MSKEDAIEALKIVKRRLESYDKQRFVEYKKELAVLLEAQAQNCTETEKEKESVADRIRNLKSWISRKDRDVLLIAVLQRCIDKG